MAHRGYREAADFPSEQAPVDGQIGVGIQQQQPPVAWCTQGGLQAMHPDDGMRRRGAIFQARRVLGVPFHTERRISIAVHIAGQLPEQGSNTTAGVIGPGLAPGFRLFGIQSGP
jgi:hypothetical protein